MSESKAATLRSLRGMLAEKFPQAEPKSAGMLPLGLAAFDSTEGGLRRGAVTELTGRTSSGTLFIDAILSALHREKCFGALVDAGGSFDPCGTEPALLPRLLWVRCTDSTQAIKAADLLVRDGNMAVVILDLQARPLREVRRIPATTWHRFQRLAEPSSTAFIVLTTKPLVESARVRISMPQKWPLKAMRQRRKTLLEQMQPQIFVRHTSSLAVVKHT